MIDSVFKADRLTRRFISLHGVANSVQRSLLRIPDQFVAKLRRSRRVASVAVPSGFVSLHQQDATSVPKTGVRTVVVGLSPRGCCRHCSVILCGDDSMRRCSRRSPHLTADSRDAPRSNSPSLYTGWGFGNMWRCPTTHPICADLPASGNLLRRSGAWCCPLATALVRNRETPPRRRWRSFAKTPGIRFTPMFAVGDIASRTHRI